MPLTLPPRERRPLRLRSKTKKKKKKKKKKKEEEEEVDPLRDGTGGRRRRH